MSEHKAGRLRAFIESVRGRARQHTEFPASPKRVIAAAQRIRETLGEGGDVELASRRLDEVRALAQDCWRQSRSFDGLPRWCWRYLGRAMLHPEHDPAAWLAREPELVAAYAVGLRAQRRIPRAVGLLKAFFGVFPVDEPAIFDCVSTHLAGLVRDINSPVGDSWRKQIQQLQLLHRGGPARVAAVVMRPALQAGRDVPGALGSIGFSRDLDSSKFIDFSWKSLLASCHSAFPGHDELVAMLRTMAPTCERLERPGLRLEIADSLLSPFRSHDPAEPVRQSLTTFFMQCYGDPAHQVGSWQGTGVETRAVLLRWLARGRVQQFFSIVDQTALDRHWLARKQFWTPYLNSGAVTEAWLALGRSARTMAQAKQYAELGGAANLEGGVQHNHTVLLMKIRGERGLVTVTEWSHMGMCRMWADGSRGAPALYRPTYAKYDLMTAPDHEQIHYEGWQARLRAVLRQEFGVPGPS